MSTLGFIPQWKADGLTFQGSSKFSAPQSFTSRQEHGAAVAENVKTEHATDESSATHVRTISE